MTVGVDSRGERPTYELIVIELAAAGVRTVFGLMAEDTAVLTAALGHAGIDYHPAKHENVAVNMADGYAWASERLGVVMVGRGPGLTNAATALATLARGRRPVVVLSTVSLVDSIAVSGDLKIIDQEALAAAVGLDYVVPETAEDVVPALRAAILQAQQGRPCIYALPLEFVPKRTSAPPAEPPAPAPIPVEPSSEAVDELRLHIDRARRPLVLAGGGAFHAREELIALAERIGGVLGTSLVAKDLFRGHPLEVRIVGGFHTDTARSLLREADYVFSFGASLNMWTQGHGALFPTATVVAVDHDPSALGRMGPIDVGVVGDARLTAERVLEELPERAGEEKPFHDPGVLEQLARPRIWDRDDEHSDEFADPRALSSLLDEMLPQQRQLVTDAGHFTVFPAIAIRGPGPRTFRQTAEFIAVGMGIGGAVGAALARPDLTTVLAVGDGGLAMTLGDLEPLIRLEQPVIVIVYNDQAYGAERHMLDMDGWPHELATVPDVDFARLAEAMGIEGATVRSLDDLRELAPRFEGRTTPIVVDCKINPAVRARYVDDLNEVMPKRVAPHNEPSG